MNKVPIVIREAKNGEVFTKFEQLETEKDISKKTVRSRLINEYVRDNMANKMSLCGDCALGPTECPKIRDISKKIISEYPFIIDGYQIQDVLESEDDKKYVDSLANLSEYEKTIRKNGFRVEKFIVHKYAKYRRTR